MRKDSLNLNRENVYRLVEKYSDRLVLFAYCIVGDYFTAEDTVADAIAGLLVKNLQFDDENKLKSYLYKSVRSRAIDSIRRVKYEVRSEDMEEMLTVDGEREIFERENSRQIYISLQQLPKQYRDALCLAYIDGFSVDEICKIIGKTKKQVYNLLSRAKSALKSIISEDLL